MSRRSYNTRSRGVTTKLKTPSQDGKPLGDMGLAPQTPYLLRQQLLSEFIKKINHKVYPLN